MCRLYAFVATSPMRLECALLRAQNSLLAQSRMDEGHEENPDGWGIAYYDERGAHVEHRERAAFADLGFLAAAHGIRATTAVAHVRRGTVGRASVENVHPFRVERWVFAHNGGLPNLDEAEPRIAREIAPDLMHLRRGETDSELIFLWILTWMRERHPNALERGAPTTAMIESVRQVVQRVEAWCGDGALQDAALNFVLTDGESLVASRFHCALHFLRRDRAFVCELCRRCHCHECASGAPPPSSVHGPRAFVVASEPITSEPWTPVPEETIVGITAGAEPTFHSAHRARRWSHE